MSVNNKIDTSKPKELIKRHKGTITHYYHLSEFVYTKNCLSLWKKVKPLIQSCDKPFIYFNEKNHIICFVEGKNGEELQIEINDENELTYLDYPVLLSPLFF